MTLLTTPKRHHLAQSTPTIITVLTDALINSRFGSLADASLGTSRTAVLTIDAFAASGFASTKELKRALNIHLQANYKFAINDVSLVEARDLGVVHVTLIR